MMNRSVPFLVLVAALAVTACGSDKKSSASGSTTTAPAAATYTGDKNSPFCQIAEKFILRFENLPGQLQSTTAANLKDDIQTLKVAAAEAKQAAPSAVKSDVKTLSDAFDQFVSRLDATGYDPRAAVSELPKLGTNAVATAAEKVQGYSQQVCGIGTPSSTP